MSKSRGESSRSLTHSTSELPTKVSRVSPSHSSPASYHHKKSKSKAVEVTTTTSDDNSKTMMWVLIAVVVVLVAVVIWIYRRMKHMETRLHNIDRSVEQALSKHEKALTEKIEQFEKSSSTQRQFIQEKVDELTRTVQQHMAFLRSTVAQSPEMAMPCNMSNRTDRLMSPTFPPPPNPISNPMFAEIVVVPPPAAKSGMSIEEVDEDLDAELSEELKELEPEKKPDVVDVVDVVDDNKKDVVVEDQQVIVDA